MEFFAKIVLSSLLVPLTLLPIINPVGNAPIFMSLTRGSESLARQMSRQVALNSWIMLMLSMLVGTYVLKMFGISLEIVRLAGGMLVAATGWRLLHTEDDDAVRSAVADQTGEISKREVAKRSFFPMSFPLTAGPGAIAASIALGTTSDPSPSAYLAGGVVAALGTSVTASIVYLCYRYASYVLARLGEIGTIVMMRLVAFILMCIGLQMMWTGWADLNAMAR
jgi:multiple antibiotic resistance protein